MTVSRDQFVEWLRALDLAQVAISATIDAHGRLGEVGGLWPKLLAAAKEAAALGPLRVVVVSENQAGLPPEPPNEDPFALRIIKAATLQEAVEKLYEEHGPRAAVRRYEQYEGKRFAGFDILGRTVPLDPQEKHYQVLPLLKRVKRLPRERRGPEMAGAPRTTEGGEVGLHPTEIARWEEEALGGDYVGGPPHKLEDVFGHFRHVAPEAPTDVPRFIVVGPPGSGKTTLARYLAWWAATGGLQLAGRRLVPARVSLRAWERWAEDPKGASLSEYLAAHYQDAHKRITPAPTDQQWRRWLERGEVLLLLDGLDELADSKSPFLESLSKALEAFAGCPTVLTCRTVSFEQHAAMFRDLPVFIVPGLEDDQIHAFIRAYQAEPEDPFDSQGLIDQIDRMPQVRPLVTNPLLLAVICFVSEQTKPLPSTRGELYNLAVNRFLTPPKPRVAVTYPGGKPDLPLIRKRRILERTALVLFVDMAHRGHLGFNETRLVDALTAGAAAEGLAHPADVADALREELVHNTGILRGHPHQGYIFLHLTVQEFLASSALASIVNDQDGKGWKSRIIVGGKTRTVRDLVDKKAWDPRWQEVIVLLAGQLRDPAPLVSLLADRNKDDLFRHRLALAALCLPEIPQSRMTHYASLVDGITTTAFSLWWQHKINGTHDALPHLARALPALGQVSGRMRATLVLGWLDELLERGPRLRRAEGISGTPLLEWLCQQLSDADRRVQEVAVEALGAIGSPAGTPESRARLANLLGDAEERARVAAAEALGRIGPAAATAEILASVAGLLRHGDEYERAAAAEALGRIGPPAATPEILALLADIVQDPDKDVRRAGALAVGRLGPPAVTPEFLARLVGLLRDPHGRVQRAAAEALTRIGPPAVTPEMLASLADLLVDGDDRVRAAAAEAFGRIGPPAATPEFLARLVGLLRHPLGWVKRAAVEALGRLGPPAATPEILASLAGLLRHGDEYKRAAAAEALGRIGPPAVTPEILASLADLLGHEDDRVRAAAAEALGRIGSAAAAPEILAHLAHLLRDPMVDEAAAEALGRIGPVAATPEILARLAHLLRCDRCHRANYVRGAAAEALGRIGSAAAAPEILARLAHLLRSSDGVERESAGEALGQLLADGVRIFRGRWGRLRVEAVAELSQ